MENQRGRTMYRGQHIFVVDGGEKSGELQSITVNMFPAADDIFLNDEEYITLICNSETVSDQIETSFPLDSAGTCRMRIIEPPVFLTKNGMKMTPVKLRLRLRKVEQGQTGQKADGAPVRLRFHLRCLGQERAAQDSAVAYTQESDQEAVSLIADAPSPASQVPPENDQRHIVEESLPPETTPEAKPTTPPVSDTDSESENNLESESGVMSNVVEESVLPKNTPTPKVKPTTPPVSDSDSESDSDLEIQFSKVDVAPASDSRPRVQKKKNPRPASVCSQTTKKEEKPGMLNGFWKTGLTSSSESESDNDSDSDSGSWASDSDTSANIGQSSPCNWYRAAQDRRKAKSSASCLVFLDDINKTLEQLQTLFRTVEQVPEAGTSRSSRGQPEVQNVEQAAKMIAELPVDTNNSLKNVIKVIYYRAVSDHTQATVHADLCQHLKNIKVQSSTAETSMTFQKMLLLYCMDEFKTDIQKTQNMQKSSRYYNKMMFLSELFKKEMITAEEMHGNIAKLLKDPTEVNLYHFCCLMCNIGQELDAIKSKTTLEKYFQQIQKLLWKKKISSQMSDMLQEVFHIRNAKWPPKKLGELQKSVQNPNFDGMKMKRKTQSKSRTVGNTAKNYLKD